MKRIDADASLPRRALGGHAAIGLLASALLYLVTLTGSLAVVHDQWTRWEQPRVAEVTRLSPDAAQAAMAAAMAQKASGKAAFLTLQLPSADLPRAVVSAGGQSRYLDAAGRLGVVKADDWTSFVVAFHEYLTLPASWGMILVGALGVALAALGVTGVLAHPRIVRDAFRLRARHDGQVARVDWHNRLGVWTLPFALAVALTGAIMGLGSVGTGVMARVDTGGDTQKLYAPVFGAGPVADAAPAPLADAGAALRTLAARRPGVTPTYVFVRGAGTRGQDIQIVAAHPRRLIYGETYLFDAHGGWRGAVGLSDGTLGQQVAASNYNLHFGNFAGPVVEIAYLLLGLCLCGVIATGTSIWLHKRQMRGLGSERPRACWIATVWGTPAALLLCIWGRALLGTDAPLTGIFWAGLGASLVAAALRPGWTGRGRPRDMLALAVAATAAVHLLIAGSLPTGPLTIDLCGLAGGLAAATVLLRRRRAATA